MIWTARAAGAIACIAVTALVFPTVARAAETDPFEGRSLRLEAQAGRAMPLGYYGLALDLSLFRELALSAGIGFSYEASFGTYTQKMIASRYRYPLAAGWAVAAGGGMSFGTLIQTVSTSGASTDYRWWPAVRVNAELSVEYRPAASVDLRAFAGLGYIVNEPTCWYVEGGTGTFEGPCDSSHRGDIRAPVFFGVALAHELVGFPAARAAHGGDGGIAGEPAAPEPLLARWYGWQTFTADALALGLALAARSERNTEWAYASQGASAGIYLGGAPAVHLAQRKPVRGLLSLAARVVFPLLGASIGLQSNSYECSGIECAHVKGLIAGAVAASLLDAAAIAYR